MNVAEATKILWESFQQGMYYPEALQGQLRLEDGYQVQLGMLARWLEAGEQQAGWKIGLSAEAVRQAQGIDTPIFGYLLASGQYADGTAFQHAEIVNPAIESELCMTVGKRLQGPGVTPEQVADAMAKVAPAFEVVSLRGNLGADLPLGVADNVAQWGYVTGVETSPYPADLDLGEVRVEVMRNGALEMEGRGADVIDNQLQSVAWLANELAKYDRAIEAGHCIMTGSFNKPIPVAKGDRWETHFAPFGTITASFV